MDIYDVRQVRLRQLLVQKFANVQKDLADGIGVEPNYASRLLTNKSHRKRIGEDLARQIEQRLRLTAHWMDSIDGETPANRVSEPSTRLYMHDVTEEGVMFAKEWERLSAPLRAQVQALVHCMVAEAVREDRVKPAAEHKPKSGKTSIRPSQRRTERHNA